VRVLSIATLFPNPTRPGFGIFVGNQMRAVAARGDVDLAMISPIGMPPWPLSLKAPYAKLRSIPDRSDVAGLLAHYPRFRLVPKFGGDSNPGRTARAVLPMARRLHAEQVFDVVDAQFFFPDGPAAAIVARDLGLPLTIKARGADIHYWGTRPRALQQMLSAAHQSAGLLAVSKALRDDMIALGMPGERIAVHYTGLDRERFHPMARGKARAELRTSLNLAIEADAPLLVTPGALIPRKGQRMVIEALATMPKAQLLLAGSGADESSLRALARDRGLAPRVHLLGQVSHALLPTLMCAADVMVLPSSSEGLANVWVEALACGTPIVVPDVGGACEIVKDRSAGRIAARDASAIAAAVADILATPPAQNDVAANVAQFSWDTNAATIVRFWQDVRTGRFVAEA
jgi:glycosyltransferase involved in cell wall biosynthesis